MKTQPAKITFVRLPCEDKSIVSILINRGGKSVGTIEAQRHETHRAMNGNATYCTGAWVLEFTGEGGHNLLTEDEAEFPVLGFRPSRHWNVPARAATGPDVSRALAEAKAAATAWMNAHPDYV